MLRSSFDKQGMTMDMLIGAVLGVIATILTMLLFKKDEYKDRSVIKLYSKHIGGLKFKFIARSMSKETIWIRKITFVSENEVESEIVFPCQIIGDGGVSLLVKDMPAEFTGSAFIKEIDAKVKSENNWQDCVVIIRGVKDNEVDLEFFSEAQ